MDDLAMRYTLATRIPRSAFKLTVENYGERQLYSVVGEVSKLPDNYCTIDQICVSDGIWREKFDEQRLAYAEYLERQIQAYQNKVCTCHCHQQ